MLHILTMRFLYLVASAEDISNCRNRTASDTFGLLITDCTNRTASDKYCYIFGDNDAEEAQNRCNNIGSDVGLPQDQSLEEHQRLLNIMAHLKLDTIWLSLRKKKLGSWTWINNGSGHDPIGGKPDGQCGAYILDGEIDAVKTPCFTEEASKYLCEHNSTICPSVVPRYNCMIVDGQAVSVHGGVYDWFTARAMCRNIGADLLHTDKTGFKKDFEKIMESQEAVFVGLYREDWLFMYPRGCKTSMKTVFWEKKVENNHSCAVLNRSNEMWIPSSCGARHPYICQIYKTGVDITLMSQPTWSPTSDSPYKSASDVPESEDDGFQLLLLVSLVFVGVLIISVILSFLTGRRCSMGNRSVRHEDDTTYYAEIKDCELCGHACHQRSKHRFDMEGKLFSDGSQVPKVGTQKHLYEKVMDENRSTGVEIEIRPVDIDFTKNPNVIQSHKCTDHCKSNTRNAERPYHVTECKYCLQISRTVLGFKGQISDAEAAKETVHAMQEEMVSLNDDITTMIPNPVYVSAK